MTNKNSLNRSVGLPGAILLGLGSILGTGVFLSLGLAVGLAGNWAVPALGIAALLALCNALSSAQLAAAHPVSGGTYAYGKKYLNDHFGFTAGLAFLLAKSASAAAAAIGFTGYVLSGLGGASIPLGVSAMGVALIITGLVASGLRRANIVNAALVGLTLVALLAVIAGSVIWEGSRTPVSLAGANFAPSHMLEAAALLFVAFTGYGRIATLGEEVKSPRQTIPKAILTTLMITALLYFGVLVSGLSILGAADYADVSQSAGAPLFEIANRLSLPGLPVLVLVAGACAMAGVLLNLILGLSRVAFAMGRDRELPPVLGQVSKSGEPLVAVFLIGGLIAALALWGGLSLVWSFSAFTVLVYYAITNLAALKLPAADRLYPRIFSFIGLTGCLWLALWIDPNVMLIGAVILGAGLAMRLMTRRLTAQ